MKSHPRLSELLVETKAFKDLETPVILASGQLSIYYVKAENLVQDNGVFGSYENNSRAMINHAVEMTQEHPTFGEVIDILAEQARGLIGGKQGIISGGQRRDWLFSGPVARKLGLTHVSLYKDGKAEMINAGGKRYKFTVRDQLSGLYNIHIVDLLTEGSSCYRQEDETEKGWIPEIRKRHGIINDLIAVVTRLQGGEENLAEIGVNVHANVAIDEDFLRKHSANPQRALDYNTDPHNWGISYLNDHGALALLPFFNPAGGKLDKAKNFIIRYGGNLRQTGRLAELDEACKTSYGRSVNDILAA